MQRANLDLLFICIYIIHVWLVLLDMTALILDLSVIISTMYYKRLNTEFERLFHCNPQYKQSIFVHILSSMIETFFWIMIYLWLEGALFVYTHTHKLMSPIPLHCVSCRTFVFFSNCYHLLYFLHCLSIHFHPNVIACFNTKSVC